jgi:hypothetical protein
LGCRRKLIDPEFMRQELTPYMPRITKVSKSSKPALEPGYEGRRELAPAFVPDPYDKTSLRVTVNIGGDPVEMMFRRRQIDDAQYQAAMKIRRLHEQSGAIGAKAIDYGREHVDGGRVWTGISDVKLSAADQLAKARFLLGQRDYTIVIDIAGDGKFITDICPAAANDRSGRKEREHLAKRFHEALDFLAKEWGFSSMSY